MSLEQLRDKSFAQVKDLYIRGYVNDEVYEAYCWLWRHAVVHFSSLLQEYDKKPCPVLAIPLAKKFGVYNVFNQ